ncbi:ataxin-7-like protein 1 isoform X2 [Amia ocellicauda]|uniref:ataxin-7-like protein 1 isoform X2 n=1 Tax=Amia ocellicauda TaxID=2972642 RepID=UPI0034649B8C
MATLDRRLPSPDAFLCKPWSAFIDAAKSHCSDNVEVEETGKEVGTGREVMRLGKEDMHLFGHYPAQDEFYLVVCNICNQAVKPQVFQTHCDQRHGSVGKPSPAPVSPPCNSRTLLVPMKPKVCVGGSGSSNAKPFRTPKDNLHTSISKPQHTAFPSKVPRDKPCVPVVSLEKMPHPMRADGANVKMNPTSTTTTSTSSASSSTTSPAALVKPALTSAAPRPVPPSDERTFNGRGLITPSSLDKKHQNGNKSSNKPYKRLSEREFDPNKHCGVLDPETKKPCTRSLTCKTHSLTYRRAVPGRRKQFDILLAEHKTRAREKEEVRVREPPGHSHAALAHEPPGGAATSAATHPGPNGRTASPVKSRLANSNPARPSPGSSVSGAAASEPPAPVGAGEPGGGRLSSDEGEPELPEESERLDCHYSGRHPRAQGFCTFGSRLMGRGYYVFDRRWDRLRLALNSMVEKHVNSQMWKKIPPAAESPLSSPAAQLATALPVLQALGGPGAVYLSSSSSGTPPYPVPHSLLSSATSMGGADGSPVTSPYSAAFPHGGAAFNVLDPPFKSAPTRSQPRTKTSKTPRVKDLPPRGGSAAAKKKKPPPLPPPPAPAPLQSSSASSYAGAHRRNCVLAPGAPLNSRGGSNNGTTPLSAKSEPSGRAVLSGSSADPVKRVGTEGGGGSTDPALLMPPLAHLAGDHALSAHNTLSGVTLAYGKADGKKRKNAGSSGKPSKVTKVTGVNSVHRKSTASLLSVVPGSPNSTLSRQPKVHH